MSTVAGGRSLAQPSGLSRLRVSTRGLVAAGLGGGVGLAGFAPFSNAPDVLAIGAAPWRVVLTPPVLLALAVLGSLGLWRARERPAHGVLLAFSTLLVAAAVSLIASDDLWHSFLLMVLAVAAPAAVAVGLGYSDLPARALLGGLIAAVALMALRADAVFFQAYGIPDATVLYFVKAQGGSAYGFQYYLLNNPTGSAVYLLLPYVATVFWLPERGMSRALRVLLLGSLGVLALTLVLLYSRSPALTAAAATLAVGLRLPLPRIAKVAAVALAGAGAVYLVAASPALRAYLTSMFSTGADSSGNERWQTIKDGVAALQGAPLTGVGLGRFNAVNGVAPAHSSPIQAGAEMGVAGLIGYLGLTAVSIRLAWVWLRTRSWFGPHQAAAVAAAVYLVYNIVAGGANEGLYSGYVPAWGLTLGLLLGLASRRPRAG